MKIVPKSIIKPINNRKYKLNSNQKEIDFLSQCQMYSNYKLTN